MPTIRELEIAAHEAEAALHAAREDLIARIADNLPPLSDGRHDRERLARALVDDPITAATLARLLAEIVGG